MGGGRDEGRGREREGESEGEGVGGEGGGVLADLLSLSPSLSHPLFPSHSDLRAGGARLDDRWARSCRAQAPGLDSGLACVVSRSAVRGGADPALRAPPCETDKVYTWFAIGVQEAEKVCSKFTCRFA